MLFTGFTDFDGLQQNCAGIHARLIVLLTAARYVLLLRSRMRSLSKTFVDYYTMKHTAVYTSSLLTTQRFLLQLYMQKFPY